MKRLILEVDIFAWMCQVFNLMCYEMQGKRELLHAINIFLDDVREVLSSNCPEEEIQ
jgi:hypothetical protein